VLEVVQQHVELLQERLLVRCGGDMRIGHAALQQRPKLRVVAVLHDELDVAETILEIEVSKDPLKPASRLRPLPPAIVEDRPHPGGHGPHAEQHIPKGIPLFSVP
jgi:hypothetical protein